MKPKPLNSQSPARPRRRTATPRGRLAPFACPACAGCWTRRCATPRSAADPNGTWYLTGTVEPFWAYDQGILLWRSPDRTNWTALGFVWRYGGSPWHKLFRDDRGRGWSTCFGRDPTAPWRERAGELSVEFDAGGRVGPGEP